MAAAYALGGIVGYVVAVGIGLLLTFWVVRAAILSALAEDRRRATRWPASMGGRAGRHWMDEDGR